MVGKIDGGEGEQNDFRVTSLEGYCSGSQPRVIVFLLPLGYLKMCGGVLVVMTRMGKCWWLRGAKCSNMCR